MRSLTLQVVELWRLRALLRLMTVREIRSRFTATSLGLVWLYAQPLLTVAAYYLIFDIVLRTRLAETAPTRSMGVYLVVGMVPWMAFVDAVSRAMHSLVEAGGVLQKNALAPALFPARAVAASAVTYLPPILLLAIGSILTQGLSFAFVWLPVLLVIQFSLSFILGYVLAILAAAMRDVLQIIAFCLSLGVFASPILYTVDMIPPAYAWLLWLNPMTPIVLGIQSVLLAGVSPPTSTWVVLGVWLGFLIVVLGRLIRRSEEHLVDWL